MRTIGPNKNNRIISESELNMSRFYFLIKTKKGHKRPRHIVRLRAQCGRHSRRGCRGRVAGATGPATFASG